MQRTAVVHQLFDVVDDGASLVGKLGHPGQSGARNSLVARDHQAHQLGLVVQHLEHRHRDHRRAVGVGDDALREAPRASNIPVEVDFGDDERHLGRPCAKPTSCRSPSPRPRRTAVPGPATSSRRRRTPRCPDRSGRQSRRPRLRSPGRGTAACDPANGPMRKTARWSPGNPAHPATCASPGPPGRWHPLHQWQPSNVLSPHTPWPPRHRRGRMLHVTRPQPYLVQCPGTAPRS